MQDRIFAQNPGTLSPRTFLLHLLSLFVAGTFAVLAASGDIRIDQDFDSGSLLVEETRVDGDTITLAGRDNYNHGRWKWLNFRVRGVDERLITFEIGDNFASGSGRLDEKVMVYSYDAVRWEFFDNAYRDADEEMYYFYNDEAFSSDTVFVAYSFPYPYGRVVALTDWLRRKPAVSPTRSADSRLVIGQSSGGTDEIGRAIPPRNLYGFRIADGPPSPERSKVVIVSGVHANEVLANHVLEGLLKYLVGEEESARELRRETAFYVYPMANPDGRYAGYNRGGVQHERRDTNRYWHEELYEDMDDIRTVAESMLADVGGADVEFFFDFHSWTGTGPHFVFAEADYRDTVFWERLTDIEPDMGFRRSRVGDEEEASRAARSWWFGRLRLGARHPSTPETMFRPGEEQERYYRMGRNFGLALHAHFVGTPAEVLTGEER